MRAYQKQLLELDYKLELGLKIKTIGNGPRESRLNKNKKDEYISSAACVKVRALNYGNYKLVSRRLYLKSPDILTRNFTSRYPVSVFPNVNSMIPSVVSPHEN